MVYVPELDDCSGTLGDCIVARLRPSALLRDHTA